MHQYCDEVKYMLLVLTNVKQSAKVRILALPIACGVKKLCVLGRGFREDSVFWQPFGRRMLPRPSITNLQYTSGWVSAYTFSAPALSFVREILFQTRSRFLDQHVTDHIELCPLGA